MRILLNVALCLVFLVGCSPSFEGGPERLFALEDEANISREMAKPKWYTAYAQADRKDRKKELRNQIIFARLYAVDLYYTEYEANLTKEKQGVGFLSTVANLALTGTATAISANETKTVLTAVAQGLTGAKSAYNDEVLIEKTILIIQQQMRTRRKEVKVIILDRLLNDTDVYPLEMALGDVEAYYRAGTLNGAFVDVSELVGAQLTKAKFIESRQFTHRFSSPSSLAQKILDYYNRSQANRNNLYRLFSKPEWSHITSVTQFVHGGGTDAEYRKVIRALNIQ